MRHLVAALAFVGAASCTTHRAEEGDPIAPADSCVYASDGVCDEPRNCALGSDSTDCDEACRSAYSPAIAAACDYDGTEQEPPLADTGSHGEGGPVGFWEGTLPARGPSGPDELIDRYYRVYVPSSYDPNKPTPVLYVLGGFRVDYVTLPEYTELPRIADLNGVILVYLQAHWRIYGPSGWVYQWYVFRSDWSPSQWAESPDIDFVRKLTGELKSLYNVDRTRVYASGHSRGAAESIILAFELPDLVAGFLSESGFTGVNSYDDRIRAYAGARRVAGVIVHGIADQDVPVKESDATRDAMTSLGYAEGSDFAYYRLPGVTHQWQPQYNQQAWDFLSARPLPLEMAAP